MPKNKKKQNNSHHRKVYFSKKDDLTNDDIINKRLVKKLKSDLEPNNRKQEDFKYEDTTVRKNPFTFNDDNTEIIKNASEDSTENEIKYNNWTDYYKKPSGEDVMQGQRDQSGLYTINNSQRYNDYLNSINYNNNNNDNPYNRLNYNYNYGGVNYNPYNHYNPYYGYYNNPYGIFEPNYNPSYYANAANYNPGSIDSQVQASMMPLLKRLEEAKKEIDKKSEEEKKPILQRIGNFAKSAMPWIGAAGLLGMGGLSAVNMFSPTARMNTSAIISSALGQNNIGLWESIKNAASDLVNWWNGEPMKMTNNAHNAMQQLVQGLNATGIKAELRKDATGNEFVVFLDKDGREKRVNPNNINDVVGLTSQLNLKSVEREQEENQISDHIKEMGKQYIEKTQERDKINKDNNISININVPEPDRKPTIMHPIDLYKNASIWPSLDNGG